MSFFTKIKNGWNLGMTSLEVIKDNPKLLFFPLLSGMTILLVLSTFVGGILNIAGANPDILNNLNNEHTNSYIFPIAGFIFYLISFFIVIFFNVALVHNARLVFDGEDPTVGDGIRYAQSRIGAIFSWSVLAATVAVILKTVREKGGLIGNILGSIAGALWSFGTYFVVPVLAYENLSPMDALRKSVDMMKKNWGEAIGANFSFGIFSFLGFIVAMVVTFLLLYLQINPIIAIGLGVLLFILTILASEAAKTVFLAAAYQYLHDEPHGPFDDDLLDSSFYSK